MATRFESIYQSYYEMASEIEGKYKYENMSSAFGHIVIKLLFGVSDDDIYEMNTDGYNDNGIDALFIDNSEKCLHIFQFKFPESVKKISNGVTELM